MAEAKLTRLAACIDKDLDLVQPQQELIRRYVATIQEVAAIPDPTKGRSASRQSDFDAILIRLKGDVDPTHENMANLMESFHTGLFADGDEHATVQDNLDLERWFRVAKGHERRIHDHRHGGSGRSPQPTKKIDDKDIWPLMAAEPHARGPHTAIFYHNGWQLEVVSTGPWKPVLPKMYYAVTEPGKDDMPGKHLWTNARQAFYDFHNEIGEQTDVALEHPL